MYITGCLLFGLNSRCIILTRGPLCEKLSRNLFHLCQNLQLHHTGSDNIQLRHHFRDDKYNH